MSKSNAEIYYPTAEAYAESSLAVTEAAERKGRAQQALEQLPEWPAYVQARQQYLELERIVQGTAVYQEAVAADQALPPLLEAQQKAKDAYLEARGMHETVTEPDSPRKA